MEEPKIIRERKNNLLDVVYGWRGVNNQKMLPLSEISMSRLLGKQFKGAFAMVSASSCRKTPDENDMCAKDMYSAIRNSGFCFIPAFGGFSEIDVKTGEQVNYTYHTLAIILCHDRENKEIPFQRLYDFALNLGKKYEQESVFIKAPQENHKYIVTTARELNDLTQMHFANMASKLSSMGKNRVTFTKQYLNPTFETLFEGHRRFLNGELFLKPTEAMDVLIETEAKVIKEINLDLIKHWVESNRIGLITAYKNVNEDAERNRELMAALLCLGYGVIKVHGAHWANQEEAPDQKEYLLVVNSDNKPEFHKTLFRLSEYYNQDSFCYKSKETSVAYNVGTSSNGNPGYNNKTRNGAFVKNVTDEFITRLGNKGFTLTSNEPSEPGQPRTRYEQRKAEQMAKRTYKALTEEMTWYKNESLGAKECICYACRDVMKFLNKEY